MAGILDIPLDFSSVAQLAGSNSGGFWASVIINLLVSTAVGGLVLIIILMLFNRVYGEMLVLKRAFLAVLVVNVINFVGIIGILSPLLAGVPLLGIILPLLMWIVILKLFFEDMSMIHVIIVAAVFFALTIIALPYLTAKVMSFIGL
jgi:hypothetical protein